MDSAAKGKIELVSHQSTQEYKDESKLVQGRIEAAQTALSQRGFKGSLGGIKFSEEGDFLTWLNGSHSYIRKPIPLGTALNIALTHGNTGWWTLEEVEHFASNGYSKSRLFEGAMIDLGFRRSKKYWLGWKRIHRRAHVSLPPGPAIQPRIISAEEFKTQFQSLLVGNNSPV